MVRFRYGALVVAALSAGLLGGKCDDLEDEDTSLIPNASGGTGAAPGDGGDPPCMPTAECSEVARGEPGFECMAKRDNRGQTRVQMRQVWSRNMSPAGLANHPLLAPVLVQGSELIFEPTCNPLNGAFGGYSLLLDWDKSNPTITQQTARLGYADLVPKAAGRLALSEGGLCMVSFKYHARAPGTAVPEETFNVAPSINARRETDFTLEEVRGTIPDGQGTFYYNEETHEVHGYSPVNYVVVNVNPDEPTAMNVVPIRHAELRVRGNDASNNCAGRYRPDSLDQQCQPTDPIKNPAWGCTEADEASGKCQVGQGAAHVRGYFRIIDLERVMTVFGETLCVVYSGKQPAPAEWIEGGRKYCSRSPHWGTGSDQDPLRGGDYCSLTNEDGGCRDSWKTETYLVLQGFPIRDGVCTPKNQDPL